MNPTETTPTTEKSLADALYQNANGKSDDAARQERLALAGAIALNPEAPVDLRTWANKTLGVVPLSDGAQHAVWMGVRQHVLELEPRSGELEDAAIYNAAFAAQGCRGVRAGAASRPCRGRSKRSTSRKPLAD